MSRRLLALVRPLLAAALLLFAGTVAAHAHLAASAPADATVIAATPETVAFEYTEPVEVMFSQFGVHRFDVELPEDPDELTERDWQRLSAAAGLVVSAALDDDDEKGRVDTVVETGGPRADRIVMSLAEELEPGAYVAFWRVLSIDTHVTDGFITFVLKE